MTAVTLAGRERRRAAMIALLCNIVVMSTDPEVVALLRAYLDAVGLSEGVQSRIWKAAMLTLAQIRVLRRLARGPRALGELAVELGISPTSMTRLIDRLEERGLVERRRDDPDRRRVVAALRPAGRDLVAAVPLLDGTPIWAAAENLAPDDRRRITAALQDFVGAVREADPEAAAAVVATR